VIPLKLRLHNFMCYRGDATLDLAGIHLACVAGDNGHGKSALLDGLTYALWGETRARREDDLITIGADDMEVELEFMLGSERHRVIRKRGKRGKTRVGALELQLWDGEQFTAQTGASSRETQARINQLLKLDYETFTHSAFLQQRYCLPLRLMRYRLQSFGNLCDTNEQATNSSDPSSSKKQQNPHKPTTNTNYMSIPNPDHEKFLRRAIEMSRRALP